MSAAGLAQQLAAELVDAVKPFGGGMDSTGLQFTLPLTRLKGHEAALVEALAAFVARVGVAAARHRQ